MASIDLALKLLCCSSRAWKTSILCVSSLTQFKSIGMMKPDPRIRSLTNLSRKSRLTENVDRDLSRENHIFFRVEALLCSSPSLISCGLNRSSISSGPSHTQGMWVNTPIYFPSSSTSTARPAVIFLSHPAHSLPPVHTVPTRTYVDTHTHTHAQDRLCQVEGICSLILITKWNIHTAVWVTSLDE